MIDLDDFLSGYPDTNALKVDGFDSCVVGYDPNEDKLVYSIDKCIEHLVENHEMDIIEATEHFEFNISGAYIDEHTPVFIYTV